VKAVAELESKIKGLAVSHYSETQEKKPVPGVEVKIFTVVDYDEKAAREWCFTNLRPALKLDKTEFEKMAKSGNVEIAQVRTEPRAQIASDLDKMLKDEPVVTLQAGQGFIPISADDL